MVENDPNPLYTNGHGETLIPHNGIRLLLSPHLPFIPENPPSEEKIKNLIVSCERRTYKPAARMTKKHAESTQILSQLAGSIYRAYYLNSGNEVSSFTEVPLSPFAHLDCLIIGSQGAIIIEIKKKGLKYGRQLTRYKEVWQFLYPDIPVIYLHAAYTNHSLHLHDWTPL